ncbi:MAG TPA: hypothetical protein VFQ61_26045 [Polyangiaceae bacterium]|nr:hypothetical protein [Polyangiaceae bacterium]
MPQLGRNYWIMAAILAYASLAAARTTSGPLPWLALVALPLLLSEVFRRTEQVPGDDRYALEARSGVRLTGFGAALLIAARTGESAQPALDALANLGAGASAVGSLLALSRLPALAGLLDVHRAARSLDAVLFTGFLWGLATAVPAGYAILPPSALRFDPLVIDYVTSSAGIGSLLVMVAATLRLRFLRRLELGTGDRVRSAFALCIAGFTVAVPAAWLDVAAPDRLLPATVVVVSSACAWASITREATLVTRMLRGVLALTLLGAPLLVAATTLSKLMPEQAPAVALVSGIFAVSVGLAGHAVARPLGPEQSRWLVALDRAARDALQPEPQAALRAALLALGKLSGSDTQGAEIWQKDPPDVLSVDVAGYLTVTRSEAPERIYELGMQEPERTLRADILKALEVKRAEVRGVLAWLESRKAFSATIVVDDDGPVGFVLLPRAGRSSPLTLEEARAARLLADRVSSVLAVSAALARSRDRERAQTQRADALNEECQRLEHIIQGTADRHRAISERLARGARSSAFGFAARNALLELERAAKNRTLIRVIVPQGSDGVAYAAHFHLASPRAGGPFIVVDAATPENQTPERFEDEANSPFTLADGGTLVWLNVLALSIPQQDTLSLALSRRLAYQPRSSILPPGVLMLLPKPAAELVERGMLSGSLARWFDEAEIQLPRLSDRSEDFRSIALDCLTRECLAQGRPPIGLESSALRTLIEHDWARNEAELGSVLGRALALASGPTLTLQDLEASGFQPTIRPAEPPSPLPGPARRRTTRRPKGRI